MDEDLSAELLERAGRDQAARMSLRPGHGMLEWETLVAPVDRDNTARLREIVARHGWPGRALAGEQGAHAAWLLAHTRRRTCRRSGCPCLRTRWRGVTPARPTWRT
jgi:hypothetical protein